MKKFPRPTFLVAALLTVCVLGRQHWSVLRPQQIEHSLTALDAKPDALGSGRTPVKPDLATTLSSINWQDFLIWSESLSAEQIHLMLDSFFPCGEEPIVSHYEHLVTLWLEMDSAAAKAWILECPDGPLQNCAIALLAGGSREIQRELLGWFQKKTGSRPIDVYCDEDNKWRNVASILQPFDFRGLDEIETDLAKLNPAELALNSALQNGGMRIREEWLKSARHEENWPEALARLDSA